MLTKSKPIRSRRIREAARGQPCTIRLPGVCRYENDTTVFCHFSYASSGMGTKPSDVSGAFGCAYCHRVVDGRSSSHVSREDVEWCKARGMAETWARLVDMGVIQIKGAM